MGEHNRAVMSTGGSECWPMWARAGPVITKCEGGRKAGISGLGVLKNVCACTHRITLTCGECVPTPPADT